jgi:hypothetical protein
LHKAELDALNQTFAAIERGINNLNARMQATMAFVACLPGAETVDDAEVCSRLARTTLAPVLDGGQAPPEAFVAEAVQQLRSMASAAASRAKMEGEAAS